jgi:hypothetical protein
MQPSGCEDVSATRAECAYLHGFSAKQPEIHRSAVAYRNRHPLRTSSNANPFLTGGAIFCPTLPYPPVRGSSSSSFRCTASAASEGNQLKEGRSSASEIWPDPCTHDIFSKGGSPRFDPRKQSSPCGHWLHSLPILVSFPLQLSGNQTRFEYVRTGGRLQSEEDNNCR